MSWDIVLFNSGQAIKVLEEIDEELLEPGYWFGLSKQLLTLVE
ncbi:MAG: hypothetical protein ABUL44_04370 [Flavobacterium sp.]